MGSQDGEFLYKIGYLHIKGLISDPAEMRLPPPPKERSKQIFFDLEGNIEHIQDLKNSNSIELYNFIDYGLLVHPIKKELQNIMHEEVFSTFWKNKYYFKGDSLAPEVASPEEEVQVCIVIDNINCKSTRTWIRTKLGDEVLINLEPGDALVRMTEGTYLRKDPIEVKRKNIFNRSGGSYVHEVFFNYVRADGYNLHLARGNG